MLKKFTVVLLCLSNLILLQLLSLTFQKLKAPVAMAEWFAHYLHVDPVCMLCRSCLGDFGSALGTFYKNTSWSVVFIFFHLSLISLQMKLTKR